MKRDKTWELNNCLDDDGIGNALDFVRGLADYFRPHKIAVALTGSVLEKGRSEKDIDIILYPYDTSKALPFTHVQAMLRTRGLTPRYDVGVVRERWRKLGSGDMKHVEVWRTSSGRRVDVFFFGFPDPEPSFIDGRVV